MQFAQVGWAMRAAFFSALALLVAVLATVTAVAPPLPESNSLIFSLSGWLVRAAGITVISIFVFTTLAYALWIAFLAVFQRVRRARAVAQDCAQRDISAFKGGVTIGHRGCRIPGVHIPENSWISYLTAVALGADGIELDVQLTADGELVCFHDQDIARVLQGTGFVHEMTYAQLCAIPFRNLGAKPRVPGFKHDAAERPFKGGMDDSDAEDAPFASAASTSSSAAATAGETDGAAWARTLNDDGGFSWGKRRSCPEWPGSGAVAVWRVPLVRDVLRFVAQHKLLVVLDVKEVRRVDEAIAQLHELLRQYDLYPRTLLSAFDPAILLAAPYYRGVRTPLLTNLLYCRDLLQWYHEDGSDEMQLPWWLNVRPARWLVDRLMVHLAPGFIASPTLLDADAVGPHNVLLSRESVEQLTKQGFLISTWTVNCERERAFLQSLGVGCTTDLAFPRGTYHHVYGIASAASSPAVDATAEDAAAASASSSAAAASASSSSAAATFSSVSAGSLEREQLRQQQQLYGDELESKSSAPSAAVHAAPAAAVVPPSPGGGLSLRARAVAAAAAAAANSAHNSPVGSPARRAAATPSGYFAPASSSSAAPAMTDEGALSLSSASSSSSSSSSPSSSSSLALPGSPFRTRAPSSRAATPSSNANAAAAAGSSPRHNRRLSPVRHAARSQHPDAALADLVRLQQQQQQMMMMNGEAHAAATAAAAAGEAENVRALATQPPPTLARQISHGHVARPLEENARVYTAVDEFVYFSPRKFNGGVGGSSSSSRSNSASKGAAAAAAAAAGVAAHDVDGAGASPRTQFSPRSRRQL